MRFFNDGEEFGVATSQTDVELAKAGRNIVEGLLPFADALGLTGTGRTGECDKCGEDRTLRPCAAHKNGKPIVVHLCETCQEAMVEEMMQGGNGSEAAPHADVEVETDEPVETPPTGTDPDLGEQTRGEEASG